jgi:MFS family permease
VHTLTATRVLPAAYRPVLAHRTLRRLLLGFAVSYLGDGMSAVAVALLAIRLAPPGRAALLVGAAVAAYSLPGVVGAIAFGRWLRRLPARGLLTADSALRACLLGGVPLCWAAGVLRPAVYVALLAGSSLLHAWGMAGKYTLLAELLPPEQRLAGNALVSSLNSACGIAGPVLAGLLVAAVSPAWVIGLDALSFAVLAVQAARTVTPARETATDAPVDTTRSATGLRLLRRRPELLGLLVLTWVFYLLYGPVEVALPLYVTDRLHAPGTVLGLYWTTFGVGAILGSLVGGSLRRLPLWPATIGIVAGWGAVLVPFGFAVPVGVTLACFALGGVIYGPYNAMSFTLFQARTPAPQLSAVLAARSAVTLTADPIGTVLGGPLTAALGPSRTLAGSGLATVLLAVLAAPAVAVARRARASR